MNQQNGYLEEALASFQSLIEMDTEETRRRGFDFSKDYRVLNQIGVALFDLAKLERGEARKPARLALLEKARASFEKTLELDPENLSAHYNLGLLLGPSELNEPERAKHHQSEHRRYKPDDNSRDSAVAAARRRDPAANHASEAVVLYDLGRPGAIGLPAAEERQSQKMDKGQ